MNFTKKFVEGTSYLSFFLIWVLLVTTAAFLYWHLSYIPGHGPEPISDIIDPLQRFWTALYFSVVTGTTVGFGDIVPHGYSRLVAAIESILSYVLLAVFVARVASFKQDYALKSIHSLARDSLFNNFRHGLFIARKDLDAIIKKIDSGIHLEEKDWKNMRTAFRQIHTNIRSIPQLYASRTTNSMIDEDHEQLVLDSVERSLRRAREAEEALQKAGTTCQGDEKCMAEITQIVGAAENSFITLYPHAYNDENDEAFQEMLTRLGELRALL